MRKAFACAIIMLMLTGCGSASQPVGTTASAPRRAVPPTTTKTVPSVDTSAARDLLRHPTPRPPGVRTQFDYVGGAGPGACFGDSDRPQIRVFAQPFPGAPWPSHERSTGHEPITFGSAVDVCFNGFGAGPVIVQVDEPGYGHLSGILPRTHPPADQLRWASYDWVPAIDETWPLGRYTVIAHTRSLSARTSFRVVPPSQPGLRVLGPSTDPGHNEVAPNSLAKVFLSGFAGTRSVELVIYRLSGFAGTATYYSSARVPTPASGDTVVALATGHPKSETTFIVTVRSGRYTLSGAFTVIKGYHDPTRFVGPLPSG